MLIIKPRVKSKRLGKRRLTLRSNRRLFEAARGGVLLLDPRTRKMTDVNPFMTEILGC